MTDTHEDDHLRVIRQLTELSQGELFELALLMAAICGQLAFFHERGHFPDPDNEAEFFSALAGGLRAMEGQIPDAVSMRSQRREGAPGQPNACEAWGA